MADFEEAWFRACVRRSGPGIWSEGLGVSETLREEERSSDSSLIFIFVVVFVAEKESFGRGA